MMHANILETRAHDQDQVKSEKAFSHCVKRLNSADRDYFRRRAEEETEATRKAACCESRLAHEELARAYRLLCSSNDAYGEDHLTSELAMYQSNPKQAD